jgi:hypothetical protein
VSLALAASPHPKILAAGFIPKACALLELISTNAAAPSLNGELLAAVMEPPFTKTDRSVRSLFSFN